MVVASMWKHHMGHDRGPKEGSFLCIEFCDDEFDAVFLNPEGPDDPHLRSDDPSPPPATILGPSTITTVHSEKPFRVMEPTLTPTALPPLLWRPPNSDIRLARTLMPLSAG
ncbi:hypothetical protein BDZ91DRAFT_724250 [Kalaharituber pfeilii]|nr:hypothetical protein BDZ91DRAFT_724250 [Kalaharituber pfeilii]